MLRLALDEDDVVIESARLPWCKGWVCWAVPKTSPCPLLEESKGSGRKDQPLPGVGS